MSHCSALSDLKSRSEVSFRMDLCFKTEWLMEFIMVLCRRIKYILLNCLFECSSDLESRSHLSELISRSDEHSSNCQKC